MPLPLFKNAYKVKGLEIRNENVGCLDKPILFAISSGKVIGESLIFHLKKAIITSIFICETLMEHSDAFKSNTNTLTKNG